jgi:hypothetical protein
MTVEQARQIANAVLYEGYVLYPYRASAVKNCFRWQFGIVAPRAYSEEGGCEPWRMQTECLLEPQGAAAVDVTLRFLQVQARSRQGSPTADEAFVPWEEGIEHEVPLTGLSLESMRCADHVRPVEIPGGREHAPDGVVRERWPISARIGVAAEPAGPWMKLRVWIENVTPWTAPPDRASAMRRSLTGTHLLLALREGAFLSMTDPPEAAREVAAVCHNLHTWPVLVGPPGSREVMLSAPIILSDYPAIAPESPGEFCDGTEIDELLTLRVMTLTDAEKREACGTDERARAIVERSDAIPVEVFERLHGAIRSLHPPALEQFFNPMDAPLPELAVADVGGGQAAKGARVILRPRRRADAMDMFLAGRAARVESVQQDVDGRTHVAVVVEDDPASDLHEWYGRFFYFDPDELELSGEAQQER